nr:MAG TPA: hypothetical protein [Caudoviricetes sp.]
MRVLENTKLQRQRRANHPGRRQIMFWAVQSRQLTRQVIPRQ